MILAGNTAIYIFPLCVLFLFRTLAALYESWKLPLVIILIVPMCLLAAIGVHTVCPDSGTSLTCAPTRAHFDRFSGTLYPQW